MLRSEAQATRARTPTLESDLAASASVFGLIIEHDGTANERFTTAVSAASRVLGDDAGDGYRIFTTAYDREQPAIAWCARDAARRLPRAPRRPDRRARRATSRSWRASCSALLAVPRHDGWDSAQEEGRIDGRRLAQLVASPTERRLFRSDRIEPVADCALTFLIDCSGSMKQHIEAVAMLLDVFARALEQAGVTQRGARLHHRRLERRACPARLDPRRPARASGPAQRGLPHRLQGCRHALAPGAPAASPRC